MPLGGERSVKGKIRDFKEGLYLGDEHSPDDPHMGLPTFGSNVFPDAELPGMKPLFLRYHEQMKGLGNRMMRLLALALDLPEDYLETHVTMHEPVVLPRMFRYLPQEEKSLSKESQQQLLPQDQPPQEQSPQWGIGEHSDYGLWTMILTDAPGLEFQHPTTKTWHEVPFLANSIIMNVGDVLDRLTAGRFVSAYHRARNLSTSEYRLSLPFFYDPSWHARMKTLPLSLTSNGDASNEGIDAVEELEKSLDTPERAQRWSKTKITCAFDGKVEYSEFLAKKVAKVFPDLVPEEVWKNLKSTSLPSTRHALVVESPDIIVTNRVKAKVMEFYNDHPEIKTSHGIEHVLKVYDHACKAISCHAPSLGSEMSMKIKIAALLHDVDDSKYFPNHTDFENARSILKDAQVDQSETIQGVLLMIGLVSCSKNGNNVPESIIQNQDYHLLIPRWADRLEAVGAIGVVRCYQYNTEHGRPLCSENSPRAVTEEQVWKYATPERFVTYTKNGGHSDDMISHYYDKLLHIARPPKDIVRNSYLEKKAAESSNELVEMCIRYGKTGIVDEDYIREIEKKIS